MGLRTDEMTQAKKMMVRNKAVVGVEVEMLLNNIILNCSVFLSCSNNNLIIRVTLKANTHQ